MKKFIVSVLTVIGMAAVFYCSRVSVMAQDAEVIPNGLYVEELDVSGMTEGQATLAIQSYVDKLLETELTIQYEEEAEITATAAELGGYWKNTDLPEKLVKIGKSGNVVTRYKIMKDLEHQPVTLEVELGFDEEVIAAYIEEHCREYDQEVQNYSLVRKDGAFQIIEGQVGYEVNAEASAKDFAAYLNDSWDRKGAYLALQVDVVEPLGSEEQLSEVKDVLGTYSTNLAGATAEKYGNIKNGANLINAATIYPDEEFSFDAFAAPYTVANGYLVGKAYESGRLVDSIGGGICQVSSTLYNAVLRAELEVSMRFNHSMIVGYVPISSDATLAESSGKDFRFINDTDTPIYIEAYVSSDKSTLTVNIYGKETRPSNRTVEYVSETLEVINPGPDVITVNAGLPVGSIEVSSAYTGYKARLWKIVKVDGVEQSREQVNSSTYRAVARMATVGTQTDDPNVAEQLNAAIATGNIDHVKNVIAALTAPPQEEQPAEE